MTGGAMGSGPEQASSLRPGGPPFAAADGMEETDVALVLAVARGDRAALARLYDRYASTLLAVGMRILGERREAEDVLHDVFLEVWRAANDYSEERGTVR